MQVPVFVFNSFHQGPAIGQFGNIFHSVILLRVTYTNYEKSHVMTIIYQYLIWAIDLVFFK